MAAFKDDGETLTLGLPFTIPYLDTSTISVNKANFQTIMRITVVVCTYLTFRPHLARLYRQMTGQETRLTPEELKARVEAASTERRPRKTQAVAGEKRDAGKVTTTPSKGTTSDNDKSGGSTRRRKA